MTPEQLEQNYEIWKDKMGKFYDTIDTKRTFRGDHEDFNIINLEDETVNIEKHLDIPGNFIIFEKVGNTYKRRLVNIMDYIIAGAGSEYIYQVYDTHSYVEVDNEGNPILQSDGSWINYDFKENKELTRNISNNRRLLEVYHPCVNNMPPSADDNISYIKFMNEHGDNTNLLELPNFIHKGDFINTKTYLLENIGTTNVDNGGIINSKYVSSTRNIYRTKFGEPNFNPIFNDQSRDIVSPDTTPKVYATYDHITGNFDGENVKVHRSTDVHLDLTSADHCVDNITRQIYRLKPLSIDDLRNINNEIINEESTFEVDSGNVYYRSPTVTPASSPDHSDISDNESESESESESLI